MPAGSRETRSIALASGPISARRRSRRTAVRICSAAFSGLVMKARSNSFGGLLGISCDVADARVQRALRAMFVLIPPGWTVVTETLVSSISSSMRRVSVKPRTANLAAL